MRRLTIALVAICFLAVSGCSVCAPGYLDDYATVGGKWQRTDPAVGRVGSIFSDPGTNVQIAKSGEHSDIYYDEGIREGDSSFDSSMSEEAYDSPEFDSLEFDDGPVIEAPQYEDGTIILGEDW